MKNQLERNQNAKAMRSIHKLLVKNPPVCDCSAHESEQMDAEDKYMFSASAVTIGIAALIFIGGCFLSKPAHADSISTYRAVNAIIGEAENQGYTGMLAVACAIHNRGTLKGVYGEHAPRVLNHKYSKATLDMAIKAWAESTIHDITNGATGWGNTQDGNEFAKTKWWKNCEIVFRHKDHFFYKDARS